jgi:hypothetical protein
VILLASPKLLVEEVHRHERRRRLAPVVRRRVEGHVLDVVGEPDLAQFVALVDAMAWRVGEVRAQHRAELLHGARLDRALALLRGHPEGRLDVLEEHRGAADLRVGLDHVGEPLEPLRRDLLQVDLDVLLPAQVAIGVRDAVVLPGVGAAGGVEELLRDLGLHGFLAFQRSTASS